MKNLDKKRILVYLLVSVSWLFYHFYIAATFWAYYSPLGFFIDNFENTIRNYGQVFYLFLSLHDFAINLILTTPFVLVFTTLVKGEKPKPLLVAAIVVFIALHRQSFSFIRLDSSTGYYFLTSLVGTLVLLPVTFLCVERLKRLTRDKHLD